MRYRLVILSILLIFVIPKTYSQDRLPYIAVIPFSAINVSRSDAEVISELFETALVKTDAFRVIEQAQMNEILKVQEFSLSDCTSEECAVDIGQLLSAEQIILGTLASVGGKYILTAKFVDVAKGVSLKADKVERPSLAEMTEGAEVLAYKLAGLTYRREEAEAIVEGFGDVFIETDPAGADVYVNGVSKGTSPLLVTKVPLGSARIESRKGDLYGMEEVRLTQSATTVFLKLAQQHGSLYVRGGNETLQIILDGEKKGSIGTGLLERIPVGQHKLELEGEGLYWADEVEVRLGVITQVEAVLQSCGSISYSLPSGVKAEISGESFHQILEGSGILPHMWEGRYSIVTTSDTYEPYSINIFVKQGQEIKVTPKLFHTKEHEFQQFNRKLEEIENQILDIADISQEDIDHLISTMLAIDTARYTHPELVAKSEFLLSRAKEKLATQEKQAQLVALTQRQNAIEETLVQLKPKRRAHNWGKWLSLSVGVVSLGTSGIFFFLADDAYQKYLDATTTSDVIHYRDEVSKWKTGVYICLGVGGAGLGSALLIWATQPKVKRYETELAEVNEKIQRLEGELE